MQLSILKALKELFDTNYAIFSTSHIQHILDSLDRLLSIVHRINSDAPLWKDLSAHKRKLFNSYAVEMIHSLTFSLAVWSGITEVEQDALTLSLHIMFRMYSESPDSSHASHSAFVERRLFKFA